MARRFWWVNQNQTYRHERAGGYLWSPKRKANGARNPFYDFMRVVAPGDVILSFVNGGIPAYSVAVSPCYETPKPDEFGRVGSQWSDIGWRVDVVYRDLERVLRPVDVIETIRPLLPAKYAPLRANGHGIQSVYLTQVPSALMHQLALLMGRQMLDALVDAPAVARDSVLEDNPIQERWERALVEQIVQTSAVDETTRQQIIDARVGQGRFRSLVHARERQCRVTRVDRPEHLIASHIRPWRHSDNDQRLDPENGFMLTPNVDHLFDRGFITFENSGRLVYSPAADRESLLRMGLDPDAKVQVGEFSEGQREYLGFHRDEVFLGTEVAV